MIKTFDPSKIIRVFVALEKHASPSTACGGVSGTNWRSRVCALSCHHSTPRG
jgi:hypothetical protein